MELNKNISKEDLSELVGEWAKNNISPEFRYRVNQQEVITDIIYNWFNGKTDYILEAPTGSGKSFIAMSVAGVLSSYFKEDGYILISDLSLLEQYEKDVNKYFPNWGLIRGQQTYLCDAGHTSFMSGLCRLDLSKYGYSKMKEMYPECSKTCEYIVARDKAMNSKVTICTYAFWILQQNFVKKDKDNAPFKTRYFTICDEAHKLLDIIQGYFSPKFGSDDCNKMMTIVRACPEEISDAIDYVNSIKSIRADIAATEDTHSIKVLLEKYISNIGKIGSSAEKIKNDILGSLKESVRESGKKLKEAKNELSKEDKNMLASCNFIEDHIKKFTDYIGIIDEIGHDSIIKNDSEKEGVITFNCIDESYLMENAFHAHTVKKLYMSATIGDFKTYAKETGMKNYAFCKLPSMFDFSLSPIFYVPDYRLSYKEKDYSIGPVIKMIEGIMNIYKDYRGIIQTGNYSIGKELVDRINPELRNRVLVYEDTAGKQNFLETYKYSLNKVLVGPSLVEGISLDDDLCRFQIIMKVPYPSLKDKFVSAKYRNNPQWYSNKTAISILQGVGRGIRNEKDWCTTFILDGCFTNILNTSGMMFDNTFMSRVQMIPSETLLINKN